MINLQLGTSLCLHQARLADGGIMFLTCPSVRPSVHPCICLSSLAFIVCLLPNLSTWHFDNEQTNFYASWHKWSIGTRQGRETINFGARSQRSRSHEIKGRFGGLAEASSLAPWVRYLF